MKTILNKEILRSFWDSKGRFFSILLLMGLGAFALVGLKVAEPIINHTADAYLDEYNTMDLSVMSDYGLDDDDVKELNQLKDKADLEYGYFSDVIIKDTNTSVRLFSKTDNISKFELVKGNFPKNNKEIALTAQLQDKYKIGDNFKIDQEKNDNLKGNNYKVVGFVNSTEIISTSVLGPSSAGTGNLDAYAVVSPKAFDMDVYTIARIKYHDLTQINAFDDDYKSKLDAYQKEVDSIIEDNGDHRLASIRQDAEKEIKDGEEELADSRQKLKDTEKKLKDGHKEIKNNRQKLKDGQKEIEEKQKELDQAKTDLANGWAQLDDSKAQLNAASQKIADGENQLAASKAELDEASQQFVEPQAALDSAKAQLDDSKAQLDQGYAQIDEAKGQLAALEESYQAQGMEPSIQEDVVGLQEEIANQEASLAAGQDQYDQGLADYQSKKDEFDASYASYQEGLNQYQAGVNELESKKTQYQAGLEEYQAGAAKLEDSQAQYDDGVNKLEKAKKDLDKNKTDLDKAQKVLEDKQKEFDDKKADAEEEIADGEEDLKEAKENLNDLSTPAYTSYTRRTIPGNDGYVHTIASSEGITKVGNIFPIVLYLVAALVTETTMTRFVNEERTNAGVLKALGYSNLDVMKKFALYGLTAGILGTILGIIAGNYFLPPILEASLFSDKTIPHLILDFYWPIALFAIVCSVLVSCIPPIYIAHKELKETSSQLLLPKPPAKGASILLEKIGFIWSRLNFIQKVTVRNIFRYKQRMLMTIFGVAGSVALLLSGLGSQASLSGIVDRQFEDIIQFDALVVKDDHATDNQNKHINQLVHSNDVDESMNIMSKEYSKNIKGVVDKQDMTLLATEGDSFEPFVHLYDVNGKDNEKLKLPSDGAIISEKLAKLMKAKVGDTFTVQDDLNNEYTLKIAGISELYAGHFIYVSADYYKEAFHEDFDNNAYLLRAKDRSDDGVRDLSAKFMAEDEVKTVIQNTALINRIDDLVTSLNTVMNVLTIASVMLAIVILYNLTNINVAERIRELSTIKVLGFLNREVTLYIYRETIILSLIGIVVGLGMGKLLHWFIVESVAPENILVPTAIHSTTYLVPTIAIVIIIIVLGFLVNHLLKRVDMLEALKSVD